MWKSGMGPWVDFPSPEGWGLELEISELGKALWG